MGYNRYIEINQEEMKIMNSNQLYDKLSEIYFSMKNEDNLPKWMEEDLYDIISKMELYNLHILEENYEDLDLILEEEEF